MKHYSGIRRGFPDRRGEAVVTIHETGRPPRPLDPRLDLRNHSPTGCEWGYAGSGPAQLALALAADTLGDDDRALAVYAGLKFILIAALPVGEWTISAKDVLAIIVAIEADQRPPAA